MKIILPAVLALFTGVAYADPITPIVNGLIAPTGLALPALPIPGAPGGVPGLPSGLPSGLPTELPGLGGGGLPELPGLGGGGGEVPELPIPSSGTLVPTLLGLIPGSIPGAGVPIPGPGGLTSPVGLLIGSIPNYGDLNLAKGEIIAAVLGPVNLILSQNTNPTDYQAAIQASLAHIQNALALPGGGGLPTGLPSAPGGLPGLPPPPL